MSWRNEPRKKRSKIWIPSVGELSQVVKESDSLGGVLKHYGLDTSSSNYRCLKDRLHRDGIDFSHIKLGMDSNKGRNNSWSRAKIIPLEEILVEHSTYSRTKLKARLLKSGLLTNVCCICGALPEWNGKALSLQLDHINGISDDNRLGNLRILCPNCHSQTETFAGKRCAK